MKSAKPRKFPTTDETLEERKPSAAEAKRRLDAFLKEYTELKKKYDVRVAVSEWAYFFTGTGNAYDSFDIWDES